MSTPSKRPRTLAEYRALAASEPSHSFALWASRLRGVPAAETAAALRRAAARVGGHPLGAPAAAFFLLLDIDPPLDSFAPLRDIAEGWCADCPCRPAQEAEHAAAMTAARDILVALGVPPAAAARRCVPVRFK